MAKAGKRRLPLDEVFIKDKKVSDLVYGKCEAEQESMGKRFGVVKTNFRY